MQAFCFQFYAKLVQSQIYLFHYIKIQIHLTFIKVIKELIDNLFMLTFLVIV